ncbi:hypothetical protein F4782DRAFT_540882 [Xylaria castorea]|nr:hypothetical protein F4782DRAFT_540882 [Xylaria castorea]
MSTSPTARNASYALFPLGISAYAPKPFWRPSYLRCRVLVGFTAIFILLAVLILVLFWVSNKNKGLAASYSGLHYLWTYGLTAVYTVVGAAWARSHFQAKLVAPWLRLRDGQGDVSDILLLDYVDMFPPWVVVRSLRCHEFLVAATSMVALILSLLVVLLESVGNLAFYTLHGILTQSLTLPNGASDHFAYQTFGSGLSTTAEIRIVVDGQSGSLDSEPATLGPISLYGTVEGKTILNITLATAACPFYTMQIASSFCGGPAHIYDNRIGVFFSFVQAGSDPDSLVYPNVTALHTELRSVKLLNDSSSKLLSDINPRDIARTYFDSHEGGPISWLALADTDRLPSSVTMFLETDYLERYIMTYYQKYIALLVHGSLMETVNTTSTATAVVTQNRLLIRILAAQSMAVLLVLAAILSSWAFALAPRRDFLPRNPNTLIRQAVNVAQSQAIQSALQEARVLRLGAISQAICIVVCGLIITLELLLRASSKYDGLGDVSNDTYLHYLWTTIPSIVFSLLAVYLGSVDFSVRSLVPYNTLATVGSFENSVNLDLLDKSVPKIILEEIKVGAQASLAATLGVFIASFPTIFSASLFLAVSAPQTAFSELLTVSSFVKYSDNPANTSTASSLIFRGNLSYPPFTYEHLAMPSFTLPDNFTVERETMTMGGSSMVFNGNVPAIRSHLNCTVYDSSRIAVDFVLDYAREGGDNGWVFKIGGDDMFIAANPSLPDSNSDLVYVWGRYDRKSSPNITTVSATACNETLKAVDVAVRFLGLSLAINTTNPPVPIENTTRATTTPRDYSYIRQEYTGLVNANAPLDALDPFFTLLTTSRYALPISALEDPARHQDVVDAIKFQHGVIGANVLNNKMRAPANSTNATLGASPPEDLADRNDDRAYPVRVTDLGRWRVVQDAPSTRILEALLGATLILSIISWALMPDTALLPKPPTSIASAIALLIGRNIFACLPPNAASMSDDELKSYFLTLGLDRF